MTGKETLERAVNLMHEDDTEPYEGFALAMLNLTLAELYDVNNNIRSSKSLSELPREDARMDVLAADVPYEPELAERAVILGLLCRIFVDEENNPILSMYKQEYANAVNAADRHYIRFA